MVVSAIGHLYTVTSKQKNQQYPVFEYHWVPRYLAERRTTHIRNWLKVITELAENADAFVDGCDYDIEGSIIGYTILKYACDQKQTIAKRMKYSTLTNEELQESYDNLLPNIDFALVEAGLTRHEVDWLYGINLSRALTQAAKEYSGQYATLSTGRVQGPTLGFLVEREKDTQTFVPTPYWGLIAKINIDGTDFDVTYEKTLHTYAEAAALRDACKTKQGRIETVKTSESTQPPPVPFDLGTLQSEAYRLFHYMPIRTSNVLQHLYLAALISYPRTSSQKLPPSINYRNILKKLSKASIYAKSTAELLAKTDLQPNEGKKIDPAHPAIYPPGNLPQKRLDQAEENLFDLVVKRFLSVFGEPAIRQNINVSVNLNDYPFKFSLSRTLSEGWFRYYRSYAPVKDDTFPALREGAPVTVKRVNLKEHFTQPPPRYNPRSLLFKMEREEIGTKATRATTIQTLQERKYITGSDKLVVNDLGFEVIEVLEHYCSVVVSPKMTRTLEEKMEAIRQGKETKQEVLQDVIGTLKAVTGELKSNQIAIGAQLNLALKDTRLKERTVGVCSKCGSGQLVILHSKKTGKRFVGCTNYFNSKCSTTYPLPQTGIVKPLGVVCKTCDAPLIVVYKKGRTPWRLCVNPQCPTK